MNEIITILFSLLGVVILIFLTYYGANWLNKRVKFSGNGMMKVHERVNLGADKTIMVVSVGEKYMLLGITQQNITKISDLEKDEIEKLLEEKKSASKQTFAMSLASAIVAKTRKKGGEDNDES